MELAAIRRVEIQATSRGVDQVTAGLQKLGTAHDGISLASSKTERATLSLEKSYEKIQRRFDATYRAEQDLARVERELSAARSQGLVSLSRQTELMELARQRALGLGSANDNTAGSFTRLSLLANNAAGGITAYTGALSGAVLGGAALAAGLVAAGGAIAKAGDEYVKYRNQLLVAGEDQGALNKRLAELADIAIRSRTGLEPVVELYGGISKSTQELGKTQTQVARVTETISKAFAANSTSAASAAGAILQLNQAFASGVLRGDELNSVMEGAPALARLIAKEFGIAIGELKSFGEEGKLSADRVFTAFLNGSKEVDTTFNATASTIGQASTNAGTAITQLGAELDNLFGIAARVVGGLNAVAGAIRGVAGSVAAFGDARKLEGIQASLQSIEQFEQNIAGLRGKNDFASRQDLIAETAKLAAERAVYDRLISARITEMVPKQPEILLNAEGSVTTARAARTATKAIEELTKAETELAREGMDAVQKATADANKSFADRAKIAAQMRADGVENAKIADFEARSQKILAGEIKNATDAAAKKGGSKAASGSGTDAYDNAVQRLQDQTIELRLQQEQASKTGTELYKLEATHRLRRAALQAGRSDEAGLADAIEATATAYAVQRKATEDSIEANRRLRESFSFVGDSFKSLAEDLLTGSDGINGALKNLGKGFLSNSLDALISGKGPLAGLTGLAPAEKSGQGGLLGLLTGNSLKPLTDAVAKGTEKGSALGITSGVQSINQEGSAFLGGFSIDSKQLAGGLTAIAGLAGAYGVKPKPAPTPQPEQEKAAA